MVLQNDIALLGRDRIYPLGKLAGSQGGIPLGIAAGDIHHEGTVKPVLYAVIVDAYTCPSLVTAGLVLSGGLLGCDPGGGTGVATAAYAGGSDTLKLAVVGCGGRGTGGGEGL